MRPQATGSCHFRIGSATSALHAGRLQNRLDQRSVLRAKWQPMPGWFNREGASENGLQKRAG